MYVLLGTPNPRGTGLLEQTLGNLIDLGAQRPSALTSQSLLFHILHQWSLF